MNDKARRVVLLARPGAARDRMREALDQAGANTVLEADPATGDQAAILAARPDMALIVLDAVTDEALDRFDDVLANPQIEVLFEEAEHAVGRVGWDAARWVRHLRAKLGHTDSVLPPGHEAASPADTAVPVAAATPLPKAAEPPPLPPRSEPPPLPELPPLHKPPAPSPKIEFDLAGMEEVAPVEVHSDMELVATGLGDQGPDYRNSHSQPASPFGTLELETIEETPTDLRIEGLQLDDDAPEDASRFQNDMADLDARIAAMELVDEPASAPTRGAVLVLAGIGGPDAVRQLLGALPPGFPRAVLVQQRLDGGHYDKLVAQMQRATTLPVKLAAAGARLEGATVYILPPSLGVHADDNGLAFDDAPAELLSSLPASDSAVLMLSGADPGQVDLVMKLAAAGALVGAQALDGCYDVAAPSALTARGGQAGKPADLARRLAERWH